MIRLVEIGQQAAIAAPNAGPILPVDQKRRIPRRDGVIDLVEVHEGKGFPCDLAQGVWIFDEAIQDTGTALGALMAALPGRLASQINMLYTAHRGQRWAKTGRRQG